MWLGDFSGLNYQYQELQQEIHNLQNEIHYLQNQDNQLQNQIWYLDNQVQYLGNDNQQLQKELQNLQNQYQSVEQQLQNINILTDVLFGNCNSNDISVIQVNSVQIVNGYAVVSGTVYSTGENVTLGIPISYVEKGNVNIQEFVNDVQQNNWNAYIAIDRVDLQYMNQSGWVISIQLMNQRILH